MELVGLCHLFVIMSITGSFGHFQAKKYGLKTGGSLDKSNHWVTGMSLTRQSVLKLNGKVVDALIGCKVAATAISLFPSATTVSGEVFEPGVMNNIGALVKTGIVPVVHGEVLLDVKQRCCIYGGDKIMVWWVLASPRALYNTCRLCKNAGSLLTRDQTLTLSPAELRRKVTVVFVTDVPGVFDRNPADSTATLIPRITVNADGTVDSCCYVFGLRCCCRRTTLPSC